MRYTFICQECGEDFYSAAEQPQRLICPWCGGVIRKEECLCRH